jgi:hypothetical protein
LFISDDDDGRDDDGHDQFCLRHNLTFKVLPNLDPSEREQQLVISLGFAAITSLQTEMMVG